MPSCPLNPCHGRDSPVLGRKSEECLPPIEPFNKQEVVFCIPVEPPSSPTFTQPNGRPSMDVISEMAGIHKEEEEGRLRRQLTTAEVSDGVGNDSKRGRHSAEGEGETRERVCSAMLTDSHLPCRVNKNARGSFFLRDLTDAVYAGWG